MKSEEWRSKVKELHILLQDALEIEHATIPPYFTAWISIMEGYNYEASEIIRSVVLEEMLHMTLVANLMNAVGANPDLTKADFVPKYPHILPHSDACFEINIEKFSKDALKIFMKIEFPEPSGTPPKGQGFQTIGQFYAYIRQLIDELCDQPDGERRLFKRDHNLQVQPEAYYGAGTVVVVRNRTTAHEAIDEIVEQGEGAHESIFDKDHVILGDGDGKEVAHYYRFMELEREQHFRSKDSRDTGPTGAKIKIDYSKVHPLVSNIDRSKIPPSTQLRKRLDAFADSYELLLTDLDAAFNGRQEQLRGAIARMFAVRNQGLALIRTPMEGRSGNIGLDFRPAKALTKPTK